MSIGTYNKVTQAVARDNLLHRKTKDRTHRALRSPRPAAPKGYPAAKENRHE